MDIKKHTESQSEVFKPQGVTGLTRKGKDHKKLSLAIFVAI